MNNQPTQGVEVNKLLAIIFWFTCLQANAGSSATVFLEWNAFELGHAEAGSYTYPKLAEERLATLAVRFIPNKGVTTNKAWKLVRDAVKDNFYGAHAQDECFTSLMDAQWQRQMAIESLARNKVPVHNVTVIYSCN